MDMRRNEGKIQARNEPFSLNLAMSIMITYGSYLAKKENIEKSRYLVTFE